ncbi:MAG TPA: TraB/GumN family protein [Acidiferrobacterales bacterium]|nr:TraB/GumN family protein [Acidiferrobacterales bacterium]
MTWRLSRPLPTRASQRMPIARALWLILFLVVPLAGHASECRPVAADKPGAVRGQDFNRGLLWKIEIPGIAPSYLFGTYHTNDPRITTLPCPVKDVFDRASSYTMEVITNGAGIVSMAEAMFFNDGKTLKDVLGEPLYQETLRTVGAIETTKTGGINNMKPWAVMMLLSAPRAGRGLFLDMALQYDATQRGKPTYGLETMQEQIAVFNGMSLDDQIVLLRDAVQNYQLTQDAMEELTRAYLKRDLSALLALNEKFKPKDARVYTNMMDRLLVRRNANMAERMRVRLKEGNAFVAVGALHLPGDNGLLRLLSAAGYHVTRVY